MIELPLQELLDFSKLHKDDEVMIEILNQLWQFSPEAQYQGEDWRFAPIFGSNVYINGEFKYRTQYGLPPLVFRKGDQPNIIFKNETSFTTNLHFHGLINTGLVDGSSQFGVFGKSTSLGTSVQIQFPVIRNNQAMTWYHSHAMFRSVELVNAGLMGLLFVTDEITQPLNDLFKYKDNYIYLTCMDMDLDSKGQYTFKNVPVDVNRSCFTIINGISSVQWYKDPLSSVPFSNMLYHNTTKNIVKIDIINPTGNWRVLYLGCCDKDKNIIPFYTIQTDQGLCDPVNTTIQFIPVAGRISILVDLTIIQSAYLFFYDYDLTENLGDNIFPDFSKKSSTPYPTPIPSDQQSESKLDYPIVSTIPQVEQTLVNGYCPIPNQSLVRPFLFIKNISGENELQINNILNIINNIIFRNAEAPTTDNYLKNLNPNYYYNIPNVTEKTPVRNICLWGETDVNYKYSQPGNINGVSECCEGSNRIYADLWNSQELDLNKALEEYDKSPNNYKPSILPSSEFRVTKTNDEFINITMISNDNFKIQLFTEKVTYDNNNYKPIADFEVNLPETPQRIDFNIQQWVDLLNNQLYQIDVLIDQQQCKLSDLVQFDWSFFPYKITFTDNSVRYLKSAIIKTINKTDYYVRILGRWAILQMMGKSMTGDKNTIPPKPGSKPCCGIDAPCDEELLYGVYDNYIQQWYPYYATEDKNKQNPILCPRRNAKLIIKPQETYIGLYDGFANDNIKQFCTQLKSTEIWTYINADTGDSHPLHFHLTSGFTYRELSAENMIPNTPGSDKTLGLSQTYSRDVFQIGPQQLMSFALTWPYYSSFETTNSPYIPNISSVIHCHFLPHNDVNSMMISYGVKPLSNLVSDIGFLSDTVIKTDQGEVYVENLDVNINTIQGYKIINIIQTISTDDYLICFKNNSLGQGIPYKKTTFGKNHVICYQGNTLKASEFLEINYNIYKVKNLGKLLYNVVLENHNTNILTNNIKSKQLCPKSDIVRLYDSFKKNKKNKFNKTKKFPNQYNITKYY